MKIVRGANVVHTLCLAFASSSSRPETEEDKRNDANEYDNATDRSTCYCTNARLVTRARRRIRS